VASSTRKKKAIAQQLMQLEKEESVAIRHVKSFFFENCHVKSYDTNNVIPQPKN